MKMKKRQNFPTFKKPDQFAPDRGAARSGRGVSGSGAFLALPDAVLWLSGGDAGGRWPERRRDASPLPHPLLFSLRAFSV